MFLIYLNFFLGLDGFNPYVKLNPKLNFFVVFEFNSNYVKPDFSEIVREQTIFRSKTVFRPTQVVLGSSKIKIKTNYLKYALK